MSDVKSSLLQALPRFVDDSDFVLYAGDVRDILPRLEASSVDCCVTSPPYLGLRDYGHDGQIGLEATISEYVAQLVAVFAEVRRLLTPEGTLWLNLGDSYNAYNGGAGPGARRLGRRSVGIELNADYAALAARRLQQLSLLAGGAA